jgi:hypothetical protein
MVQKTIPNLIKQVNNQRNALDSLLPILVQKLTFLFSLYQKVVKIFK